MSKKKAGAEAPKTNLSKTVTNYNLTHTVVMQASIKYKEEGKKKDITKSKSSTVPGDDTEITVAGEHYPQFHIDEGDLV